MVKFLWIPTKMMEMKDVTFFWGGCHFSIMFPSIFDNKKGCGIQKNWCASEFWLKMKLEEASRSSKIVIFVVNMWMCWFPVPQYCYVHTNGSHFTCSGMQPQEYLVQRGASCQPGPVTISGWGQWSATHRWHHGRKGPKLSNSSVSFQT